MLEPKIDVCGSVPPGFNALNIFAFVIICGKAGGAHPAQKPKRSPAQAIVAYQSVLVYRGITARNPSNHLFEKCVRRISKQDKLSNIHMRKANRRLKKASVLFSKNQSVFSLDLFELDDSEPIVC